jgi:hypothetical protein
MVEMAVVRQAIIKIKKLIRIAQNHIVVDE